MQRKSVFSVGEFYHIYNRGVDKRKIFINNKDHERFIKLLFFCNDSKSVELRNVGKTKFADYKIRKKLVDLGAFCLMPNHFHLLVRERIENGISLFMKKVLTAYVMYFNIVNKRKGRLFESSFQASHADTDEYLKYLFAYINLNPLKLFDPQWKEKGIRDNNKSINFLENYEFSSFQDYFGEDRDHSSLLEKKSFPDYFSEEDSFKKYIFEWIEKIPQEGHGGQSSVFQ